MKIHTLIHAILYYFKKSFLFKPFPPKQSEYFSTEKFLLPQPKASGKLLLVKKVLGKEIQDAINTTLDKRKNAGLWPAFSVSLLTYSLNAIKR